MSARRAAPAGVILLLTASLIGGGFYVERLRDDLAADRVDLATERVIGGLFRSALGACAARQVDHAPPRHRALSEI